MTSESTEGVYQASGIGGRYEWGTRPAVLVVDFSCAFADPEVPLGMDLDEPIANTRLLLDTAREARAPIVFATTAYDESGADGGVWFAKMPGLATLTRDNPDIAIDPRLGRQPGEPVIIKKGASAFFGTNLSAVMASQRVDTVVLTGAVTSGCVRATAIDLMQYGYPALLPAECVGDRAVEPHQANLVDIAAKYSDVVTLAEAVEYIASTSTAGR